MKTRTAFVSNSSSSSFVIALERKPESVEEMQRWLFGNDPFFPNPYPYGDAPSEYPAKDIAQRVFDDLQDQEPLTEEEIAERITWGCNEADLWTSEMIQRVCKKDDGSMDWEKMEEMMKEEAVRVAKKFRSRWPRRECYVLSYSDNKPAPETAMEHGDLFALIPHLTVSNH